MEENKTKTAVLTIQVKEGKFYVGLTNDGFEYHELNGVLHEIITENILIKVAEEELKQTKEKNDDGDISSVTGETQTNA